MVGSASLAGLFLLCAALFYPIAPCSVGRFFFFFECEEFSSFATIVSVRDGVVKGQGRRLDVLAKVRFCAILNRLISPWSETKA